MKTSSVKVGKLPSSILNMQSFVLEMQSFFVESEYNFNYHLYSENKLRGLFNNETLLCGI